MLKTFDEIIKDFDYSKYSKRAETVNKENKISNYWNIVLLVLILGVLGIMIFVPTAIMAWIIIIIFFILYFFIRMKFINPAEADTEDLRIKMISEFLKKINQEIEFIGSSNKLEKSFIDSYILEDKITEKISSSDTIEGSVNEKSFSIGNILTWIGGGIHHGTTTFKGIFATIELSDKYEHILIIPENQLTKKRLTADKIKNNDKFFYKIGGIDNTKFTFWSENKMPDRNIINSELEDFLNNIEEDKITISICDNMLYVADKRYSEKFLSYYSKEISKDFFEEIYNNFKYYFSLITKLSDIMNKNYDKNF